MEQKYPLILNSKPCMLNPQSGNPALSQHLDPRHEALHPKASETTELQTSPSVATLMQDMKPAFFMKRQAFSQGVCGCRILKGPQILMFRIACLKIGHMPVMDVRPSIIHNFVHLVSSTTRTQCPEEPNPKTFEPRTQKSWLQDCQGQPSPPTPLKLRHKP